MEMPVAAPAASMTRSRQGLLPAAAAFAGVVLLAALPFFVGNYVLAAAILTAVYLLPSLGLNVIFGYTGMLSFAQGAFFGIGAYTSAILATRLGLPFWVTVALAVPVAAAVAWVVAIPALRLSKLSFVMVTLGLVLIAHAVAGNWISLTQGHSGITNVPPPYLGFGEDAVPLRSLRAYFYVALGLSVLGLIACYWIVASPAGRSLRAIRDDELLAAAYGIPVNRYKTIAFAASAGFAAVGGALEVHYITIASPSSFEMYYTNAFLVIVLAGGRGSFWAVPVATVAFVFIMQVLSINPQSQQLLMGMILVFLVFFLPGGFGPALVKAGARLRTWWAAK